MDSLSNLPGFNPGSVKNISKSFILTALSLYYHIMIIIEIIDLFYRMEALAN